MSLGFHQSRVQSVRYGLHDLIPFYIACLMKACAKVPRGYLGFESAEKARRMLIDSIERRFAYHEYARPMKGAVDSALFGILAGAMKALLCETILFFRASTILEFEKVPSDRRIWANHLYV